MLWFLHAELHYVPIILIFLMAVWKRLWWSSCHHILWILTIVLHITIVFCILFCRMWVVKTMTVTVGHLCFRLVTSPHSPCLNIGNIWTKLLSKSHHTLNINHDVFTWNVFTAKDGSAWSEYIFKYMYSNVNLLFRQKTNSVALCLTCN